MGLRGPIGLKGGVGVTGYGRIGVRTNDFRCRKPAQEFFSRCRSATGPTSEKELERKPSIEPPSIVAVTVIDSVASQMVGSPN
jgi:hypothetical protein